MSFCLNRRSSKVFASSFVVLSPVSSFTLSCEGISLECCKTESIDCLKSNGKFFVYNHLYSLYVINLKLYFYFHITNNGSGINCPERIDFYNEVKALLFEKTGKKPDSDGFYDIDICNASNFDIKDGFSKNKNIKKPDYLKDKLSDEAFYNICKKISYSIA